MHACVLRPVSPCPALTVGPPPLPPRPVTGLAAGRTIVSGPEVATRFFVLVEGLATLEREHRGVRAEPRLQYSGW